MRCTVFGCFTGRTRVGSGHTLAVGTFVAYSAVVPIGARRRTIGGKGTPRSRIAGVLGTRVVVITFYRCSCRAGTGLTFGGVAASVSVIAWFVFVDLNHAALAVGGVTCGRLTTIASAAIDDRRRIHDTFFVITNDYAVA